LFISVLTKQPLGKERALIGADAGLGGGSNQRFFNLRPPPRAQAKRRTKMDELQAEYENLESQITELEARYIEDHGIQSRDGYIPQCFDEIGNEKLRNVAEKDFALLHSSIVARFAELEILFNPEKVTA
jgi:hypothetical protein